jgi:hypothetical protein
MTTGLIGRAAGHKAVEPLLVRNEIGAALGFAGAHSEPARGVIERSHHPDLLGLPGPSGGDPLRPLYVDSCRPFAQKADIPYGVMNGLERPKPTLSCPRRCGWARQRGRRSIVVASVTKPWGVRRVERRQTEPARSDTARYEFRLPGFRPEQPPLPYAPSTPRTSRRSSRRTAWLAVAAS